MSRELISFGEAMIRYAPADDSRSASDRHKPTLFLRSVGGDELNVCVALCQLGRQARWCSVLPEGPMGQVIMDSALDCGVDTSAVLATDGADVGTFTVLPEQRTVHYQRRRSAFSLHDPGRFAWSDLLAGPSQQHWLHMTGITPMIAEAPRTSWHAALRTARDKGIPCSMDLNHRAQLGPLSELMQCVQPHLKDLQVFVVALDSLRQLAELNGLTSANEDDDGTHASQIRRMQDVAKHLGVKRLVCCFKSRDAESGGTQKRWSVLCTLDGGVFSTEPVYIHHRPADQLGGGSAWMAGFIDYCLEHGLDAALSTSSGLVAALRRSDMLAALCQESIGDHSTVTRQELSKMETKYESMPADFLKQ
ncbi:2-dehydro-3-deoxygluconokinase-like [Sycon ciliatum]|uniref:2-dehydro-3-deoxygluconokinase-like n=1 Tax=Sycon ciliatum TaxID=27933 RepID=UPI0031F6028F|eukprot:scpid12083/ scgid25923/ Putative fructokinase-5